AVEIEAEVVAALRDPGELFDLMNGRAMHDERAKVHILDACTFLQMRPKAYDVITSQPSDPWLSGSSVLLTRDFYQLVRSALRDGGVFCQWFQLYSMDQEALFSGLATFMAVFPDILVFNPPGALELLL